MRNLYALVVAFVVVAAGCGEAASAPTAAPITADPTTATPTAAGAPATTAPTAGSGTWTIASASKATVSVREQLVGVSLPNDATLVATGAAGAFTLNADGSFSGDSKISFDLSTLTSDNRNRDNFVKQDTLNTRQFPTAIFVPAKAAGLALPLAATGDLKFTLAGKMTIKGVTKDVTFDVTGTRDGPQLAVTATARPTWRFADFGLTQPVVPARVVSIVDEIRLVVDLVATSAGG